MQKIIFRFIFYLFGGREKFLTMCFTDSEKMTIAMALDYDQSFYYTKLDRETNPYQFEDINLRRTFTSDLWA